jgi:hypothetical protein
MRWLRRLSLLLALCGGSAQAAVYTGIWDPPFGAPFDGLGWRGSATFVVPNFCIPDGTEVVSNGACEGRAAVTAAQVEFYALNAGGEEPTLTTITFNPQSIAVNALSFVRGALTQLDTSLSALQLAPEPGGVVPEGIFFGLQFTFDGPRLAWSSCEVFDTKNCRTGFNDNLNFPARFVITRVSDSDSVPEPASLALVALALASLAWMRRRAAGAQRPARWR